MFISWASVIGSSLTVFLIVVIVRNRNLFSETTVARLLISSPSVFVIVRHYDGLVTYTQSKQLI